MNIQLQSIMLFEKGEPQKNMEMKEINGQQFEQQGSLKDHQSSNIQPSSGQNFPQKNINNNHNIVELKTEQYSSFNKDIRKTQSLIYKDQNQVNPQRQKQQFILNLIIDILCTILTIGSLVLHIILFQKYNYVVRINVTFTVYVLFLSIVATINMRVSQFEPATKVGKALSFVGIPLVLLWYLVKMHIYVPLLNLKSKNIVQLPKMKLICFQSSRIFIWMNLKVLLVISLPLSSFQNLEMSFDIVVLVFTIIEGITWMVIDFRYSQMKKKLNSRLL